MFSPFTSVTIPSIAKCSAVLGTPSEVNGESSACVAFSPFAEAATRTRTEGKGTPVLRIGEGARSGTCSYRTFSAHPVDMPKMSA